MADLGHLRVDVGQDLVAVDDRLAEPITEPAERFRGGGQRLVQLDRVDLLSHIHHRLEQRVELGGHRRHVDHIFGRDALRGRDLSAT